jgi:hypothetical protein
MFYSSISALPCPRCNTIAAPREAPGTLVHYSRLLCAHCSWFFTWRRWPRGSDGNKLPRPAHLSPDISPWEPVP